MGRAQFPVPTNQHAVKQKKSVEKFERDFAGKISILYLDRLRYRGQNNITQGLELVNDGVNKRTGASLTKVNNMP